MKIDVKKPKLVNKIEKLEFGETVAIGNYYYIYCNANNYAHFIALDTGNRWDDGVELKTANYLTFQDWQQRFKNDANVHCEKIKLKVVLDD